MKYKITIEKVEHVKQTRRDWVKLFDDAPFMKLREEAVEKEQYGYKEKEVIIEETTKFYEQTRESEIDLKAIIDAFNK